MYKYGTEAQKQIIQARTTVLIQQGLTDPPLFTLHFIGSVTPQICFR